MPHDEPGDLLLQRWRAGDESAAEVIYRRYAERLWTLAESRISQRLGVRVGPEDIVQSVFRTFFRRARNGQFSVEHSGSLWRLLVQITLNKVGQQYRRHGAARRDVAAEAYSLDEAVHLETATHDPSPADAAILADELEAALADLDDSKAQMFRLSLQGFSTSQIADQMGCSRWTVRRVLDRIGYQLLRRLRAENEK